MKLIIECAMAGKLNELKEIIGEKEYSGQRNFRTFEFEIDKKKLDTISKNLESLPFSVKILEPKAEGKVEPVLTKEPEEVKREETVIEKPKTKKEINLSGPKLPNVNEEWIEITGKERVITIAEVTSKKVKYVFLETGGQSSTSMTRFLERFMKFEY